MSAAAIAVNASSGPAATGYRTAVLESWEKALADGVELLGEGPAAQRLDETRAFFAFVRGELPALMERWHAHRAGGSAR